MFFKREGSQYNLISCILKRIFFSAALFSSSWVTNRKYIVVGFKRVTHSFSSLVMSAEILAVCFRYLLSALTVLRRFPRFHWEMQYKWWVDSLGTVKCCLNKHQTQALWACLATVRKRCACCSCAPLWGHFRVHSKAAGQPLSLRASPGPARVVAKSVLL